VESDYQGAETLGLMLARLARLFRHPAAHAAPVAAPPSPPTPAATFAGDLAVVGTSPSDWSRRRREHGALYVSIAAESVAMLREAHAGRRRATIASAERILRHEFDLLGSGAYTPVDVDRPVRNEYAPIDTSGSWGDVSTG